MAQSKPAAAPEEASEAAAAAAEACGPARRRLRAPRDSETLAAAAAGPLPFGGGGRRRRRRRVRERERASWVGEGRRSRLEARARGERPRPPRARVLGAAAGADAFSFLSLPRFRGSRRRAAFSPFAPPPPGNGARRRWVSAARPRRFRSQCPRLCSPAFALPGSEETLTPRSPFPSFEWRGGGGSRGLVPRPGSGPAGLSTRLTPAWVLLPLLGEPEKRPEPRRLRGPARPPPPFSRPKIGSAAR